jgi:thiol-disulfide isomerase/thioredoxin
MLNTVAPFALAILLVAIPAQAQDLVSSVKASLDRDRASDADFMLLQYRMQRGITPEYLDAYSWKARKELSGGRVEQAKKIADEIVLYADAELKRRPLDSEPHLPLALGAAIEVRGQALAAEGDRTMALTYLNRELRKYVSTSIATRIRKNINLISFQGKPAPALQEAEYLGPKPQPLSALRGRPVLLFFWAHWCSDCKAQGPILAQLKREYGDRLTLMGPTQLYGYGAQGMDVSPDEELRYIDMVRQKYYADLADVPVPVSAVNFRQYGASTTPTLVLVGGDGTVKMYHPGRMSYGELKTVLDANIARQK